MAEAAGRWEQLLAAHSSHRALPDEPCPDFLPRRSHRWAVADRLAWHEASLDTLPVIKRLLHESLDHLRSPGSDDVPRLAGDLIGNVLFSPGLPPAIMDVSPYWRPTA